MMFHWTCLIYFTINYVSLSWAGDLTVTKKAFFSINIDGRPQGRIYFGLFGETVPKTVDNFAQLAAHSEGFGYKGTKFHRVIKNFMVQGGDVQFNNGTGIQSIYGGYFDDENFKINHTAAGFLSSASAGPNTNGCQFFITCKPAPWLDGKHVVFGKVLLGMDIVRRMESVKVDQRNHPLLDIIITQSGVVRVDNQFDVTQKNAIA